MFNASQGNCVVQKVPTDTFFPESTTGNSVKLKAQEATAKLVCTGCPIKSECLEAALTNNEYGVWGGTTMEERRLLKRRLRRRGVVYRKYKVK